MWSSWSPLQFVRKNKQLFWGIISHSDLLISRSIIGQTGFGRLGPEDGSRDIAGSLGKESNRCCALRKMELSRCHQQEISPEQCHSMTFNASRSIDRSIPTVEQTSEFQEHGEASLRSCSLFERRNRCYRIEQKHCFTDASWVLVLGFYEYLGVYYWWISSKGSITLTVQLGRQRLDSLRFC